MALLARTDMPSTLDPLLIKIKGCCVLQSCGVQRRVQVGVGVQRRVQVGVGLQRRVQVGVGVQRRVQNAVCCRAVECRGVYRMLFVTKLWSSEVCTRWCVLQSCVVQRRVQGRVRVHMRIQDAVY